jgi:hypothetical protein
LRTFVHPSQIGKPGWTIDWQLAIKPQSIDVQRRNIKFLICQFWLDGKQADIGFLSFITIWNVALRRDFGKYRVQEESNEPTWGGFRPRKTEDFLPVKKSAFSGHLS